MSMSSDSMNNNMVPSSWFTPTHAKNLIQFLKIVGKLKHTLRTGWVDYKVEHPESIASHMYRMSIISMFLLSNKQQLGDIDITKCLKMTLIHDIAESIAGDITPHQGVSKEEKFKLESDGIETLRKTLLKDINDDEINKDYIQTVNELLNLWYEYEEAKTKEAIIIKDIDKFDMVLQALEYEQNQNRTLDTFYETTRGKFETGLAKTLMEEIYKEKEEQSRK
ncbi:hypothetical protein ABK040_009794 [Willaertia magna]